MNEMFGLLSSGSEYIPLVGVRVKGDILGRGARVKIYQRFINQEKKSMEAVYKFPLPEGAAICGFEAIVGKKKIRGQVEERDRAFEIYDDALSMGDGGYLMDEERPNIFTLSVGNLNPGAEVTVKIEYVVLLDSEGREVRFLLPTTISPRYIPDGMDENDGIPEDEKIHPSYTTGSLPYGLSLSLNVHKGSLLKSVDSPSHPIKIERLKGDLVRIAFSAESVRMDRDFILNMEYEESFTNMAYKYKSGAENFIQLDLLLKGDVEISRSEGHSVDKEPQEIIFVLDCSGSMTGDSIREAKKALEICLRGLDPATSFSIYRFGSDYESLFKKPERYSRTSLEKGLKYLREADANLGGTEILSPLKDIYSARHHKSDFERSILLLTDGKVGNEKQIFDLVRENCKFTRLFSIGIGAACNEYFIKGLARAGQGASEFIYPGERIEPKVLRLFSKITEKRITDISINWGKAHVEQAPINPAIFLGNAVTLFARYKDNDPLPDKIIINGRVNGNEKQWEIDAVESTDENLPIPLLWARERIRDIEEGGLEAGGSKQEVRKRAQREKIIIDLSKTYNILSQSTSFVAIEEREEIDKTTGELVLKKVPVPLAIGWHGFGSIEPIISCDKSSIPPLVDKEGFAAEETDFCYGYKMVFSTAGVMKSIPPDRGTTGYKKKDYNRRINIITEILSLQKAEGGMEFNDQLIMALDIDYEELIKIASHIEVDMEVDRYLLLSTAILLQILEVYFPRESILWKNIVEKSRNWLTHVLTTTKPKIEGRDIISWAEEYVRENIDI